VEVIRGMAAPGRVVQCPSNLRWLLSTYLFTQYAVNCNARCRIEPTRHEISVA
jgi:hypothetical protein